MQRRLHPSESVEKLLGDNESAEGEIRQTRGPSPATNAIRTTRDNGKRLSGWKKWLLIASILVGGLLAAATGTGYWKYKTAPPYGLSPPWYPTRPAINVGFPSLCLQDGPLGLRFADHITAFPAGITTGATWDRDLMYKRGRALGLEARLKGVNALLAPSMGPLGKHPAGGRNWEGKRFGSDPVLQAVAAVETIKGIQDEGVIATAKHYILNEQEHYRQSWEWGLPNAMSSNADDRTLHELYLWPFAESVRAQVGSVMCSYQMVNNSYACGNSKLLNGILKDELGFQGFVMSDWLASRSGISDVLAGLDMSMPGDGLRWQGGEALWGPHLTMGVLNESLPLSRLNDMVTRIVATWYKLHQDDKDRWPPAPPEGDGGPNFSSFTDEKVGLLHPGSDDKSTGVVNKFIDVQGKGEEAHGLLVRRIAAEGTVLVKNEGGVLPLDVERWLGEGGEKQSVPLKVAVIGEDAKAAEDPNACPDRACNKGTLASGWGSGAVNYPYLVGPLEALQAAISPKKINLTSFPSNDLTSKPPPAFLKDQDFCLVFANAIGGEGYLRYQDIRGDRNDLYLQTNGDRLIKVVAKNCGGGQGRTIVVIHAVGPVIVERWADLPGVKAIIFANLPGQESGNALVDVLFGHVNPSAKLPYTVGKSLEDYGKGAQVLYFPNHVIPQQNFTDGLYIDYRHFDKFDVESRYEFGYGLSYTNFELSDISAAMVKPKSAFPSPRPDGTNPPSYSDDIPSAHEAVFPAGFRKLKKYIYPYIDQKSADHIKKAKYPYPEGYDHEQPRSPAGGGEGGNPSLWDVHAQVNVTITNKGSRVGKEVVQLYLSFPPNVPEGGSAGASPAETKPVDFPVKVLRAFEKPELQPGESKSITFHLTRKDLSYWSVTDQNWVMPTQGKFKIQVGNSSRNLPLVIEL
ncbi:MAG: hypothetical protein M1816_008047 [Peltula sp. TS41687]|nr:MAG: hypothetical protein M1816_008047 [Peltula sp. TS41687]